jgi:type I restriction enzyme S subunit
MKGEKKGLVPLLRFPEFREAGEWEQTKLIDTADKKIKWSFIGGPFGSNLKSSDFVPEGIRVIQLQNIGDGEFVDGYKIFTSKEKADELLSNNIFSGDIILSKMGDPVGRACLIPDIHDRYVMCSDGIRLVVDENINHKYFVYLLINSPNFRSSVEKAATGSTRKRIGLADLKKLPMLLPPRKEEQQKIANCLSSLDALIAAQADKIDTLKTHKKGLMQQLFPREGETVPRLRFPEFRDAGEWKPKRISKLVEKVIDPVNVEPNKTYREIGIRSHGKGIFHKEEVSGKSLGNKRVFWLEVDAFVVNIVFAWERAIAVTSEAEKGMIASHRFPTYKAVENQSNVHFLKYFFLTHKGKYLLWVASPGGAGRNKTLGQKEFEKLEVLVPKDVDEQTKIADCLTSIDTLITAHTEKLDALKTHKKGLMQQLFPSPEAVGA